MHRFRLRFLLQEFDLVGPEVVIGRSPDCHVTIEDPLISRRHARLAIHEEHVTVTDLGSRNGVRVNGRVVDAEHPLNDGDRIRLGTQELLFSVVRRKDRKVRPTGYMRVCHACGTAFPEGSASCPHCGAPALDEEETVTGVLAEPSRNWTFQLLGEVIERALSTSRATEADRLMRRAAKEVDDRLTAGERLDSTNMSMISCFAVRLARLLGSGEWVAWVVTLHRRQERMFADEVIDQLEKIDFEALPDARSSVVGFVDWFRAQLPDELSSDLARLARLEAIIA